MTSAQLRVAVIGCGRMGALTTERTRMSVPAIWLPLSHAEAVSSIETTDLVAVCDSSQEQLSRVIQHYPGVEGYTDYRKMLAEVHPDIVGVATRTAGRCEIIRDCAEAGVKGIHAEKPLAGSIKESLFALDAMRANNVGFTFGAVRRYMAAYRLAKDVVSSGEIGALRQIVIEHGSDMLLWGHPHSVDIASFFCSGAEINRVQARLRMIPESVSDAIVDCDPLLDMGYLEFGNGVTAVITAGHGFNIRLFGETGSVTVVGDGVRVELRKKMQDRPYEFGPTELPFDASISGTRQAFLNLVDYINQGTPTGLTFAEVEQIHRALLAMALSEISNGQAVDVWNIPRDFVVTGRFGNLYA